MILLPADPLWIVCKNTFLVSENMQEHHNAVNNRKITCEGIDIFIHLFYKIYIENMTGVIIIIIIIIAIIDIDYSSILPTIMIINE